MLAFGCWRGRNSAFFNFCDWLAGTTIQHKNVAGFAGLDQDWSFHALGVFDVIEDRLRRQVIIPDIMVNDLINPLGFTGRCIDCNDRCTKLFFDLVAITTPIVGRAITR